jgi:putative ABC transport system substrate-binding protein
MTPVLYQSRARLADSAIRHGIPTVAGLRAYAEADAFMSYGPSIEALFRRAAEYVDRIYKGAKPTDLPIEQPTKFELVINVKTAKALGITVPPALLARADEVID